MSKRRSAQKSPSFSEFLDDQMIRMAILVIALISLMFSILEFGQVIR